LERSNVTPKGMDTRAHATKLYRQIVEKYPDSSYANQAKTRLAELEKAR
jgi:outer membrane protein assembly factor BamD (BamD/ComL family)